jgi:hypothetical protein
MKWLLWLTLPLIAACEGDKAPDKPVVPAPPKVAAPVATEAVAPASIEPPAQADDGPPPIEIKLEPLPATLVGEPEELPSERVVPAPAPASTPVPKLKPKPVVAKKQIEKIELPVVELDLSLPEDWPEVLDTADDQASMSLLPPLFDPSRTSRTIQMSGEILQDLPQTDAFIDGAQINIEFKR